MKAQTKVEASGLALLRAPFAEHHISKLPKETRAQIDERKTNRNVMVFNCDICGGHHHKNAVHLDYVGHAALTDRLLDSDIEWSWEPLSFNAEGLPAFDRNNGLWIKLTVCGVTRLGYGAADGKSGGDAIKEIIGDALRNAAMRFGAALDLWHKGELHPDMSVEVTGEQDQGGTVSPSPAKQDYAFPNGPAANITALKTLARNLWRDIEACSDDGMLEGLLLEPDSKAVIAQLSALENPEHLKIWEGDGADNPGIAGLINRKRGEFKVALLQAG